MTNAEIFLVGVCFIALAVAIAVICAQDEDSFLWDEDHLGRCAVVRKLGVHNRATAHVSAAWRSTPRNDRKTG